MLASGTASECREEENEPQRRKERQEIILMSVPILEWPLCNLLLSLLTLGITGGSYENSNPSRDRQGRADQPIASTAP